MLYLRCASEGKTFTFTIQQSWYNNKTSTAQQSWYNNKTSTAQQSWYNNKTSTAHQIIKPLAGIRPGSSGVIYVNTHKCIDVLAHLALYV